jgi:hypothetical protein
MGAERFVITTSIDGKSYRKVWRAGRPLTLGYPFHLRISRIDKGIEVETVPSGHELEQGVESQRRAFEFGEEVPVKGFDLRLRRATRAQDDSALVVNILPAQRFAPVFGAEQPREGAWWGAASAAALGDPSRSGGALFVFACMGQSVQDQARADGGYTGTLGGKSAFRLRKVGKDSYLIRALVQGLQIKTPAKIFNLDRRAESSEMTEAGLRQCVVSYQSSDWYFSSSPSFKPEKAKKEREDAETEWFQRAIQSSIVGFFSLMVLVATWPEAPKRVIKEVTTATIDLERPKELVVLPPEPVKVPEPVPSAIPLAVETPKPEPKPEPVKTEPAPHPMAKPKPEPPKPNREVPKKAVQPQPKPAPKPVIVKLSPTPAPAPRVVIKPAPAPRPAPKLAQAPEPVKAPPEPSPEQKAAEEAAKRAEAARVAEAQKQAEIARLAELQRQAEIRATEEKKAKIGAALGFMANAASTTAVKSGDYNKEGKEIAYADSAGTSELAKATGKSSALGTLAKPGQGDGTIATRSGRQINGSALNGTANGAGSGKVLGRVRVGGSGPGDGSFGIAQGGMRVEGQGSISQSALEAVMKKNLEKFQYCYEKALLSDSTLSGSVMLSWVISLQGKASSVNVIKSQMHSEGLHGCMSKEIQKISFPSPTGGSVIVKYPFNFSSSSL